MNVPARQRVQGEAAVRELRQLLRDQTRNDEPVRNVDAELVPTESSRRVAGETGGQPELRLATNAFSNPRPDMPQ